METEIFDNVKHQLMDSSTKLNAKATPYIPKGKGHTVTFAEMASRNLDTSSNCDTFLTPPGNRQKVNMTKHSASNSKTQLAKNKQQHAPPKEIQSVITGYDPVLKDNVQKITLYNIPST
uniref:Uncharacterized protein n=1 Tax=Rhizophagus irregularis (strain DAOM 181602 / DAOM 197198 / MUCL 43194) TaxID=747089 RepID=U9UTI3_RHIID